MTSTGETVTAAERRQRVGALRAAAGAAGADGVSLTRDELVARMTAQDAAGAAPPDVDAVDFAQAYLVQHGLAPRPSLRVAGGGDAVTVRASNGLALQSAVAVTLVVAAVGFVGYWLYGVVLGLAGAIAVVALASAFDWLDERVAQLVPRGRLFGLVLSVGPIVLVGLAVVLPVRASRTVSDSHAHVAALIAQARGAIAAGQLPAARTDLANAELTDAGAPGLQAARGELIVAQVASLLAQEDRKARIYDAAQLDAQQGKLSAAIGLLAQIPGFRAADQLAASYRATLRKRP